MPTVTVNRPVDRFQQLANPSPRRVRVRRFGARRVRRDFGIRVQPGAGVPSGSRFAGLATQDRFSEVGGGRQGRMGHLGIGRDEQFLLQTAVQGLASFGGAFFGAKSGVGSGLQSLGGGTQSPAKGGGQGTSPALASLLGDVAKATGIAPGAPPAPPRVPVKKPLSTVAKVAIVGVPLAAGAAFLLLR